MGISRISISIGTLIILTFFASETTAASAQQGQMKMNMQGMCQDLSPEMQQFADKLNMNNKMLFCNKFNDAQRQKAVQMATGTDSYGKQKMTPDKSVEKVAAENKLQYP